MGDLKYLPILGIIIATAFCENSTSVTNERTHTTYEDEYNTFEPYNIITNETIIPINTNDTKHFILHNERKAVLIINSPEILRQKKKRGRGRGKKSQEGIGKVESLLYEEYESDGKKLFEFMMYSMEDVSRFFASFLHTEICHVRCPALEDKDKS